ncbi:hypothetical protein GCM10011309_26240 [Litorimonas cladophorae]|uniref:Entericidin EcnA/B family protein n=1 Tax=Litorimonas cladophorae TaxID=1220491 RepID=A0A918KS24_9PROT|nr:entericidin A/B family lipoprotein [Litorimonas cladophorae]GGX74814.1 hypothetical protein GCM10011309_26240 [Litorimonas cladophorae]
MKNVAKWISIAVISASALSMTACNTIQGAGQDIESTGEAIEDAAK